jgi:hypothetical protein
MNSGDISIRLAKITSDICLSRLLEMAGGSPARTRHHVASGSALQ